MFEAAIELGSNVSEDCHSNDNGNNDDEDREEQDGLFEVEEASELGSNVSEDGYNHDNGSHDDEDGDKPEAIDALSTCASSDQNSSKKSRKKRWLKKWSTKQSDVDPKNGDSNDTGKNDTKRPNSNDVETTIEPGSALLKDARIKLSTVFLLLRPTRRAAKEDGSKSGAQRNRMMT